MATKWQTEFCARMDGDYIPTYVRAYGDYMVVITYPLPIYDAH
jgi:uncharacterized protein YqkB